MCIVTVCVRNRGNIASIIYNFKSLALIRCIVHLSFAINKMSNSCISNRALTHTHTQAEFSWLFGQYVSILYEDSVLCIHKHGTTRSLFVRTHFNSVYCEHTHSQTHKHACIHRSLSVVPGFSVPVLSFFLLVVILLDFFIVLALVRSYVRIPAIIIVRHIHAIKIHFTFEFVCVRRCMSSECPSTRRAMCVVETNHNAKLALFRWLSK